METVISVLFWDFMQHRVVVMYRRFETTYRSHLQGSSSPRRPLKMGPIGHPETSVQNCHSMLHKIPKEHRSHLHHGRSLKLLTLSIQWRHCILVEAHESREWLQVTFPAFYGTWSFNTMISQTYQGSLLSAKLLHFILSHPSLRAILMLSYNLHLVLRSGLFPSGFLTTASLLSAVLFVPHAPPIIPPDDLVILILARSTDYEAPMWQSITPTQHNGKL
jgi:hypothetical protein